MSKHTKGPWLTSGRLVYALNEKGTNSFSAYFEGENGEENARLSSAAPDLLEAAKDHVAFIEKTGFSSEFLNKLRSAISKAEGQ